MNPDPILEPGPDAPVRSFVITPAGVAGTLVLALAVIFFIRLGFWQLARLEERQALNRAVAARMDAPPIADAAALEDTTGLVYRVATVRGTLDGERSIVLPGRSHRGVPGVYLLTPLRLDGRDDAVLVNRGWVPSADAATIDIEDFDAPDPVTVRGLVLPFPGAAESLAQRETGPTPTTDGFRRVWFTINDDALRAQFPYRLLPAMVQELPASHAETVEPPQAARPAPGRAAGTTRYPARLDPPALDQGPHLGYALQWFSFALIGVIGWMALVLRGRTPARAVPPPLE